MKVIKYIPALVLLVAISSSCKKADDKTTVAPKVYKQLEKAKWFLGDWENKVNDARFTEIWKQRNDSTLAGESFVIENKDTLFYEQVDLVQRNDSLFYVVSVKDQNGEKPVSFHLTQSGKNEVVFENPKHDFPTKITYVRITEDRLIATISGTKDGKPSSEQFEFKRK